MDLHRITLVFLTALLMQYSNHMVRCVITDVQLVGGPSSNKGTVEIKQDGGDWETTCGINLDINDVIVICRQLGFTGASIAMKTIPYGQNSTPAIGLGCDGNEGNLSACPTLPTLSWCSSAGSASCHGEGYLGCFVDDVGNRVFSGNMNVSSSMSISYCIQFCQESTTANYAYAGVENRGECYCGGASDNYTRHGVGVDSDCSAPCHGDPTDNCGSSGYIAIFISLGVVLGEGVVIITLSVLLIVLVIYNFRIRRMMKDSNKDQKTQHVDLVESSSSPKKDTGFYHDIQDVMISDPSATSDGDIHYSSQIYEHKRANVLNPDDTSAPHYSYMI
ncbi:neurotrypsin-like [Lytechinus variegatus]|uniref:neurotrypsin-like n=1 Tax=Lytechinus variegatus TaxID=7654 RepID=UPI001BB26C26|nr:neurotrypsin-like [Lytechinus variegatus]